MTFDRYIELAAAILAIVGAIGGAAFYLKSLSERRRRQLRVEQHLRDEKEWGIDQGQRTVQHLMAHLGMTEKEVINAALRSKVVQRRTRQDDQSFDNVLLFEYEDGTPDPGRPGKARF